VYQEFRQVHLFVVNAEHSGDACLGCFMTLRADSIALFESRVIGQFQLQH
jgi:hypothetical protein